MKRKKIILYYALAIVLPCLVLGILAFRGIKNDQAMVEREQMRKMREAGQEIIAVTERYLSSVESSFREIIGLTSVPGRDLFSDSSLYQFCTENQVIAGVLYFPYNTDPCILNYRLLFIPDGQFLTGQSENQLALHPLEVGWQYEFTENNPLKALEYYQNIVAGVENNLTKGIVCNAIARTQKRLKLYKDAIATYNLIYNSYPDTYIQNRIPLGASALLEKGFLQLQLADTASALENTLLLIRQLEYSRWQVEQSQFAYFLSKIDEIITFCECSPGKGTINQLLKITDERTRIEELEEQTQYMLTLLINSDIHSWMNELAEDPDNKRYKTQINGKSYLIHLEQVEDGGKWALVLDPDFILEKIVFEEAANRSNENNFFWEVSGPDGEKLISSDHIPEDIPPVYAVFPPELPSWSFMLYTQNSGLFGSLLRPAEGVYFYIFIVILVILAFGLFLTMYTVNNEIRLSRLKSQFISTVSHEFKSPLTSIRQMAEMLVRDRVTSPEKKKKYHENILQQSERLSHLIDNILDFSRIEEGQKLLRLEFASIESVIKEVIDSFREYIADRGIGISLEVVEPIPEFAFDREAISQVVHNLIDNAYKYSGDSKSIEVRLYAQVEKVVIAIRDYGVGIRKEEQDKIFSRFYRAGEELTRAVKGSGIGLTIVKQLVDAHQGEILVESSPGKGSTFYVRLPLVQKTAQREKNTDH